MEIKRGKGSISISNIIDGTEPNWDDNTTGELSNIRSDIISSSESLSRPDLNYTKKEINKLAYVSLIESEVLTFSIYPTSDNVIQINFYNNSDCLIEFENGSFLKVDGSYNLHIEKQLLATETFKISGTIDAYLYQGTLDNIYNWGEEKTKIYKLKKFFLNYSRTYISAIDVPNFIGTDLSSFFEGASQLESIYNIELWNVSNITNYYRMFYGCNLLESLDLSNWKVNENVYNISQMFTNCKNIKELDLSSFIGKTNNCSMIVSVFENCYLLENIIGIDQLSFPNASSAESMFRRCELFNQPITNLNLSKCDNFNYMFNGCKMFNQPIPNTFGQDVEYIQNLQYMFSNCRKFNQDIIFLLNNITLDTSLYCFLSSCYEFNQSINNIIFPKNSRAAFIDCHKFEGNGLETCDFSNIVNANNLFKSNYLLDINFDNISFENAEDIQYIFSYCRNLDLNFTNMKFDKITNAYYSFYRVNSINYESITNINLENCENIERLFSNYDYTVDGIIDFSQFNFTNVKNARSLFIGANLCNDNKVKDIRFENAEKIEGMFSGLKSTDLDLSNFYIAPTVTSLSGLFNSANNLKTLNISGWDISNIENISSMFRYCMKLEYVDISDWDVSNIKLAYSLFYRCYHLNIDLSNWTFKNLSTNQDEDDNIKYITSQNTNYMNRSYICAARMFNSCYNLESDITNLFKYLPKEKFTSLYGTFYNASKLTFNLTQWDTSGVLDFENAFSYYKSDSLTKEILENLDTSSGLNFHYILYGIIQKDLDLSNWTNYNIINNTEYYIDHERITNDINTILPEWAKD